ncbi:short transient receptor potential channel 4-like [Centruroides sculpturatus]|uniref:short transient receptor potential channel 4-like n=1 Tax=Centruroides sculpturatus TaxID=218467 RepID=UPI000C6E0370|nr:short transient receptor potential channel 4-like [Centruroides sculpturatus]
MNSDSIIIDIPDVPHQIVSLPELDMTERKFFQFVKNGDVNELRTFLSNNELNINCVNYQGLSALHIAVENENVEMIQFLLTIPDIDIKDCVLHAVCTGNIKIIEMILDSLKERNLEFQSCCKSIEFDYGMTPLILAAQRGSIEIIRLLLKRNHRIPEPHLPTCKCRECRRFLKRMGADPTSQRLNIYRAICNPYFICLTARDPILTAFILDKQLRECARLEKEFKMEYNALSECVRNFSVDLLSQCPNANEVERILKIKKGFSGLNVKYPRLQTALDYSQEEFVAHPHIQKIVSAEWNGPCITWVKYSLFRKAVHMLLRILILPIVCIVIMIAPNTYWGKRWHCPLNRFMNEFATYIIFFVLLFTMIGIDTNTSERGPPNTGLEIPIVLWVAGFVWASIRRLMLLGFKRFFQNPWNWYNIILELMLMTTFIFWFKSWIDIHHMGAKDVPRQFWSPYDSTLIHEALLSFSGVLAIGKMLYYFQQSFHLGPIQVSLTRMLVNIAWFLAGVFILLSTIAICMTSLYSHYKGMERKENGGEIILQDAAFTSLSSSMKTLFWALFGLIDLDSADVIVGIETETSPEVIIHHSFTQAIGTLLFGSYHVLMIIIFINILIAVLTNTFQKVVDNADMEWKYIRTRQCATYFYVDEAVPSPFNLMLNWYEICSKVNSVIEATKVCNITRLFTPPKREYFSWLKRCYKIKEAEIDDEEANKVFLS